MRFEMKNEIACTKVTDEAGVEYYCPLCIADRVLPLGDGAGDDCVETDVVHRYSGNIRVV